MLAESRSSTTTPRCAVGPLDTQHRAPPARSPRARLPQQPGGASSSAASAARRPASRAASIWWNSSRPTPGDAHRDRESAMPAGRLVGVGAAQQRDPRHRLGQRGHARRRARAPCSRACALEPAGAPSARAGPLLAALDVDREHRALAGDALIGASGRLSSSEPSISSSRSRRIGGAISGSDMLAPTASAAGRRDRSPACCRAGSRSRSRTCARAPRARSSPNTRSSIASALCPLISEERGSV